MSGRVLIYQLVCGLQTVFAFPNLLTSSILAYADASMCTLLKGYGYSLYVWLDDFLLIEACMRPMGVALEDLCRHMSFQDLVGQLEFHSKRFRLDKAIQQHGRYLVQEVTYGQ